MSFWERLIVVIAVAYIAIYTVYFITKTLTAPMEIDFRAILPLHFLGILLGLLALIVVLHDLFAREFSDPTSKLLWCIVILTTSGFGLIIYFIIFANKPRKMNRGTD